MTKFDSNNLKAMCIMQYVLYCMDNGADLSRIDPVTALEAALDYLADNNRMFNDITQSGAT